MAGSILLVQPQALTQNGNPYTPQRTGSSLGYLGGFASGIGIGGHILSSDTFNNIQFSFKDLHGVKQYAKEAGKLGLVTLGLAVAGHLAGKIGEALGSVFDVNANQERRAQADGEAVLREKLAYNA